MAEEPEWQAADEASRVAWMLAALCHDLGKAVTTQEAIKEGQLRIVSPGHSEEGVGLAENFLKGIDMPESVRARVRPLVANHLVHIQPLTDRGVRRLAARLHPETIQGLVRLIVADHSGRPPKPGGLPESAQRLLAQAAELAVTAGAPKPILMGRHLLARGVCPGPALGALLHEAFEAQLDGKFEDLPGALAWLDRRDVS
jgi:tRNA nucleotidyltransferase (CCA-adding enzyme)